MRKFISLILLGTLAACSRPSAPNPQPSAEAPPPSGLASIPAADPGKYPNAQNLKDWKNPYLIVREDGIGFVDLGNSEVHILKPEQVPAALNALPGTAWPYGRVVLVAEALPKDAPEQTKIQVRKNRGLLAGTLKEMKVLIQEVP